MNNKKIIGGIIAISFFLSITLGMLDYETESFYHLLTAEIGNIIALLMYTAIFSIIGIAFFFLSKSVVKFIGKVV